MPPIYDYDDRNAKQIASLIRGQDFSDEQLEAIREYEQENKDRVTVLDAIEDNLGDDYEINEESDAPGEVPPYYPDPPVGGYETMSSEDLMLRIGDNDLSIYQLRTLRDLERKMADRQNVIDAVNEEIQAIKTSDERVTIKSNGHRRAGGYAFDDPNGTKENVPYNAKVRQSERDGDLTVIRED